VTGIGMRSLEPQAEPGPVSAAARPPRDAPRWRPRAADRYSRRVALLKRVLPIIGGALLLLVAAWPRLSPLLDSVRLGFAAIDLREARELKMLDPRYAGIDRLNRPYVVTAAIGRQVPNHNNLMSLEQPRAVMTVHGGAKVVLTAATGIYQSQTQLLDLFGGVTLTHQNGTRFVTRRAHADFSDNTAAGHDPIEGHGPAGDIWGQGFRILDKGDTIVFTGRSHSILIGSRPAKATRPPPALPVAVAKTAAQIEAAAALPRGSPAGVYHSAAAAPTAPAKPATHHSAGRSDRKKRLAAKASIAKSRAAEEPVKRTPAPRKVEPDAG
jgi:lipopolysaccharide export system protein LptC